MIAHNPKGFDGSIKVGAANSRQAFRFVSGWNDNIVGFGVAALPAAVADLIR
jgi:hypothetical protein